MHCTTSLSEQLWRLRTLSGHVTSCWLVEEGGEFDVQSFSGGKMFLNFGFLDRRSAVAMAKRLREEFVAAQTLRS
jgi:hypothetical protein